jgi:hypothetical protein
MKMRKTSRYNSGRGTRRNSKRWSAKRVASRLRRPGHKRFKAVIKKLRKSRHSRTLFPVKILRSKSRGKRNPEFVDPKWQEAATAAAAKGYPWMTWGSRDGGPLVLLGYHKTKAEADNYARIENRSFKPSGRYTVFVAKES